MTPTQRWRTRDLDDAPVVTAVWDSWQGLMFLMSFLASEEQITNATYEDAVQKLLDVKTVLCKHYMEPE